MNRSVTYLSFTSDYWDCSECYHRGPENPKRFSLMKRAMIRLVSLLTTSGNTWKERTIESARWTAERSRRSHELTSLTTVSCLLHIAEKDIHCVPHSVTAGFLCWPSRKPDSTTCLVGKSTQRWKVGYLPPCLPFGEPVPCPISSVQSAAAAPPCVLAGLKP